MDETRRRRLADSYLDHILISVEAEDRGAPFRTFLDNWYAYEIGKGHLTRGGRPIWFNNPCARAHREALSAMHFVSEQAESVLAFAANDAGAYIAKRDVGDRSCRLMVDHSVPLRIIVSTLFDDGRFRSRGRVRDFLLSQYRLGVITSDEDNRLRAAGLGSSLPQDWDGTPFARYEILRIKQRGK